MIKGLHHNAYRCRDSEATRRFYEDFLGLPLAATLEIRETKTGRQTDVLHTFYRMDDGSVLAFFEAPDSPFEFKAQHDYDLHIALEVDERTLQEMFAKGKAEGREVRGVSDHRFIRSIYFRDPNGHRVELFTTHYQMIDIELEPVRWDSRNKHRTQQWGFPPQRKWVEEAMVFPGIEPKPPTTVTTNASGAFELPRLPRGTYRLRLWRPDGAVLTRDVEMEGKRIGLVHGHGGWERYLRSKVRDRFGYDEEHYLKIVHGSFGLVDAIVFGHTHRCYQAERAGILLFNPGPIAQRWALIPISFPIGPLMSMSGA